MGKTAKNRTICMKMRILAGIIVLFFLTGCASAPHGPYKQSSRSPVQVSQKLKVEADKWLGTPHKLGGTSRKGIDCSGLVMVMYKNVFNINLPRSTEEQDNVGKPVKKSNIMPGDLVFFKTGFKKRHVGIYLGENRFIHTSASQGVMISRLDNPYWQKAYRQARRIL